MLMKYGKLLATAVGTIYVAEFVEGTDWAKAQNAGAKASDTKIGGNVLAVAGAKYGSGAVALMLLHRFLIKK